MAGKQAKVLTPQQIKAVLLFLTTTRSPERNRVMFLLSCRAGLRAVEISRVTWSMVTDSQGQLSDNVVLENKATKGGKGGRTVPLTKDLQSALAEMSIPDNLNQTIIRSERGAGMCRQAVVSWFERIYQSLGFKGCSSHSGRRTFGTTLARKISLAGGSMKNVQILMGHSSMVDTLKYIDVNEEANRRAIDLLVA